MEWALLFAVEGVFEEFKACSSDVTLDESSYFSVGLASAAASFGVGAGYGVVAGTVEGDDVRKLG